MVRPEPLLVQLTVVLISQSGPLCPRHLVSVGLTESTTRSIELFGTLRARWAVTRGGNIPSAVVKLVTEACLRSAKRPTVRPVLSKFTLNVMVPFTVSAPGARTGAVGLPRLPRKQLIAAPAPKLPTVRLEGVNVVPAVVTTTPRVAPSSTVMMLLVAAPTVPRASVPAVMAVEPE